MKETVESAAKKAVHEEFGCLGKYICSSISYCQFGNGRNTPYDCKECAAEEFHTGFIKGVQWQRSQVWHNPEEMPEQGKTLLVQTKYGPYICGPNNEYWKETAIEMSVIRWAYIDELLPDKRNEKDEQRKD